MTNATPSKVKRGAERDDEQHEDALALALRVDAGEARALQDDGLQERVQQRDRYNRMLPMPMNSRRWLKYMRADAAEDLSRRAPAREPQRRGGRHVARDAASTTRATISTARASRTAHG